MSLDKKTLLDLKDGLRNSRHTAEAKLDAHGVRESEDDVPVFDRARHRRRKARLLDQEDVWLADMRRRHMDD
jgi:hypothetical protein